MAPMPTEAQIFLQTYQSFTQVVLFQREQVCLSKESRPVSTRTSMLVNFSLHSQAKKLTLLEVIISRPPLAPHQRWDHT